MPSAQLKKRLKRILNVLDCDHPEVTQSELSVLFCDDPFIRDLNHSYRKKDKATDVLSFSAIENGDAFISTELLGDLVISVPTARRQARRFGVSVRDEIMRLLVHGVLHLFGYDHENVSQAKARKMRSKERALLKMIGD